MGEPKPRDTKRPPQWKLLWQGLRKGRSESETIEALSQGCTLSIDNCVRLRSDVEALLPDEHLATARFLATAMEEELAKVLVLVDFARLDFVKHDNLAKNLCKAFYNHVVKAAYVAVRRFPRFLDMQHVAEFLCTQLVEWRPGNGVEEPAMIHSHLLWREFSLYVDMDWLHWRFACPEDKNARFFFTDEMLSSTGWPKTVHLLQQFQRSLCAGALSVKALAALHTQSKGHLFGEDTPVGLLTKVRGNVRQQLLDEGIVTDPKVADDNVLYGWPLYGLL